MLGDCLHKLDTPEERYCTNQPITTKISDYQYSVKLGIDGIEAMEFGSGILDAEAPVDAGLSFAPVLGHVPLGRGIPRPGDAA